MVCNMVDMKTRTHPTGFNWLRVMVSRIAMLYSLHAPVNIFPLKYTFKPCEWPVDALNQT